MSLREHFKAVCCRPVNCYNVNEDTASVKTILPFAKRHVYTRTQGNNNLWFNKSVKKKNCAINQAHHICDETKYKLKLISTTVVAVYVCSQVLQRPNWQEQVGSIWVGAYLVPTTICGQSSLNAFIWPDTPVGSASLAGGEHPAFLAG